MDPLTTSLAFATVVQLLCNFRQERGIRKNAETEDFLKWLADHNFEDIKTQIQSSTDIQREIQELLREDVNEISAKLDLITDSVTSIASRIDGLSGIARAIGATSDSLSNQAIAILQTFEKSDSIKLGVFLAITPPECVLFPEGKPFTVKDGRFLADDIESLERFGLIKFANHNRSGEPLYSLTRTGAEFARSAANFGNDSESATEG